MKEDKKPENPNAFPTGKQIQICEQGMTLRDYFAAKAMHAYMTGIHYKNVETAKQVVLASYSMADEMLKQREL